jgi:DNA recombination protein RmuC
MEIQLLILFLIFLGFIFWFEEKRKKEQREKEEILKKEIQEIKEKILIQSTLQESLEKATKEMHNLSRDLLEEVRKRDEMRKEKEKEIFEAIKRLDQVITGTTSKGSSGEEILREAFKKLPPEMIETNFRVGGKIVEFALLLPNGKRLPIDSKWPASKLILELEKEENPARKKEIIEEIEKEVIKKIKEVKQYIDPDLTWPQAIAAIPDSVYNVCYNVHSLARKENVILMPYSWVLPLLLYMYKLHLQYAVSIDFENLKNYLMSIWKNLEEMEAILENKVYRGAQMISNAYFEYKTKISQIRSFINQISNLKEGRKEKIQKLKI